MASATVVEDLDVLECRVRQLCSGLPSFPVEQFDLHRRPERLHHRIAWPVPDGAERGQQASRTNFLGKYPRGELDWSGRHERSRPDLAGVREWPCPGH